MNSLEKLAARQFELTTAIKRWKTKSGLEILECEQKEDEELCSDMPVGLPTTFKQQSTNSKLRSLSGQTVERHLVKFYRMISTAHTVTSGIGSSEKKSSA